jgi:hypothetical protein
MGDPPNLDYSKMDLWVCSIYATVNGERKFFSDVQIDCRDMHPEDPAAPAAVKSKAAIVV